MPPPTGELEALDLPASTTALRPVPASTKHFMHWTQQANERVNKATRAIVPYCKARGFLAQANKLGFQVTPQRQVEQEFILSIAKRLVPRLGSNLYQVASYVLEGYTLNSVRALMNNLYEEGVGTPTSVRWHVPTFKELSGLLGDRMEALPTMSAGISRGQMAPSESCIRVVATMLPPMELSWWQPPTGRGRLQVQFMYALVMGEGDIHPPKDNKRREMSLSARELASLKVATLQDVLVMANRGFPLSPAWWRQLGHEPLAQETKANLRALATGHSRSKRRKLSMATFPIDSIRDERVNKGDIQYLVRWEGYHSSWEVWRMPGFSGQPGDPVETWEPSAMVKNTQALLNWTARA